MKLPRISTEGRSGYGDFLFIVCRIVSGRHLPIWQVFCKSMFCCFHLS